MQSFQNECPGNREKQVFLCQRGQTLQGTFSIQYTQGRNSPVPPYAEFVTSSASGQGKGWHEVLWMSQSQFLFYFFKCMSKEEGVCSSEPPGILLYIFTTFWDTGNEIVQPFCLQGYLNHIVVNVCLSCSTPECFISIAV